jgi:hypothetical protein
MMRIGKGRLKNMVRKLKGKSTKNNLTQQERERLRIEVERLKEEQEEHRKRLGITEEEENKIMDFIDKNRGKGIDDNVLFRMMYQQIMEDRKKEQWEKERAKLLEEQAKKRQERIKLLEEKRIKEKEQKEYQEKIKALAIKEYMTVKEQKQEQKKTTKKNQFFSMRITDRERNILNGLKDKGIDLTEKMKEFLYLLDKEVTSNILSLELEELKENLKNVKSSMRKNKKRLETLKAKDEKTENILIEIEKEKYIQADLKKSITKQEKNIKELKQLLGKYKK